MDTRPTEAMAEEARRGLEWRKEFKRGGTQVGVARARDISNRANLSPSTIKRMHSFFSRHEVDKKGQGFKRGEKGYPSAGRIAWALWGGDAGQSWARARASKLEQLDIMPIPVPNDSETKDDFIDRCMGDEVMVGEYDEGQRRAICEVQAEYLEGKTEKASRKFNRVAFYKSGKKTRKGYQVDIVDGTMEAVSLIQLGDAKGHGIYVDGISLATALEVLGQSNLPAFITHEGALKEDRMLKQVGVFSGFYIDEGKLKAEKFKALESFRDDQTESFNRLFDLAKEMPDAFGLSLVFEAELVWVFSDGKEISIHDSDGEGAVRKIPSVRFNYITSADFVDAPAANEDGLFSSKQTQANIMDEETKTTEDEEEKIPVQLAEPEDEEKDEDEKSEDSSEEGEESTDESEEVESEEEELSAKQQIEALEARLAEIEAKLEEKTAENAKLSKALEGEEIALDVNPEPVKADPNLVENFLSSDGAEQTHIWKQNKQAILSSLRRN